MFSLEADWQIVCTSYWAEATMIISFLALAVVTMLSVPFYTLVFQLAIRILWEPQSWDIRFIPHGSIEAASLNHRNATKYSLHGSKHLKLQPPAHIWRHIYCDEYTQTCISLSPYLEGCLLPWLFRRSFFSSAWHFSKLSPLLLCSIWYFFSAAWGGQHKVRKSARTRQCCIFQHQHVIFYTDKH